MIISGGIARNWIGVPRKLFENPESKLYRCACIQLDSKEHKKSVGVIKVYDECEENSASCYIETNSS